MRSDLSCEDVLDGLSGADDEFVSGDVMDEASRTHVGQCLRCQAEVASHRRLRRVLRSLAESPVPIDPTLEHEILLTLDEFDGRQSRRVPGYAAATLGGLAAAAGVIALATRQRRGSRLVG